MLSDFEIFILMRSIACRKMVFLFFIFFFVAVIEAGVDKNDCHTESGGYGRTVSCKAGYAPVGLCSSGRNADCSGSYTRFKCCKETTMSKESKACNTMDGGYGRYLYCPQDRLVNEVCTSGRNGDCGAGAYTRISCCDDHIQIIGSSCNWVHGHYGVMTECGPNQVITGVCSSGRNADCKASGSGSYTGIYCCAV